MAAASAPPGKYSISNIEVEVGKDKIVRKIGEENLAGSAITIKEVEKLLRDRLMMNDQELREVLYENAKNLMEKEKSNQSIDSNNRTDEAVRRHRFRTGKI